MKKLIFIFAIIFSVNVKAQDTTYMNRNKGLYRVITEKVTDSATIKNSQIKEQVRRKKTNEVLIQCGMVLGYLISAILLSKK